MIEGKGSWDDDDTPQPVTDNTLKDTSIMWFGKHKGKMMVQIPADYLLWLYQDSKLRGSNLDARLKAYIELNMDSLNQEAGIKK